MKITEVNREELSSAMQQYYDFKTQHLDKVVLFQLGDFYEMFFEDALYVSNALELTLTSKAAGLDEKIPMAGVPLSTLDDYLERLIKLNQSVVIVEQEVIDTKKKLINRKIARIVTPGTFYNKTDNDNKYSGVLYYKEYYYLSYGDINTGEMYYMVLNSLTDVVNEISNLQIKEIIDINQVLVNQELKINIVNFQAKLDVTEDANEIVKTILVNYFKELTQNKIEHLREYRLVESTAFLKFSTQTQNQLELVKTLKDQEYYGSLFWFLNKTNTAMGRRKLKEMIIHPLTDLNQINKRLDYTELLIDNLNELKDIEVLLKSIYDFERLISKISSSSISPKELITLKKSIKNLPELVEISTSIGLNIFVELEDLTPLYNLLDKAIKEEPATSLKEGGILKTDYNDEISYLHDLKENSTQWLANFENEQRELSGIKTLKVKYNKVFGYFIEVTNSFLNLVPENYVRKQTMTSCERFITNELKEKENDILNAADKLNNLELAIFIQLKAELKKYINPLLEWANKISSLDVYVSMANLSLTENLTRPHFNNKQILEIKDGFHPIVKKISKNYVNNDVYLDDEINILLITGPNMAGKSTYMRQMLVTVVMAQMGCYVPASSVNLPIFDKLFTRIGASDDLAGGKSTFMVEMSETAYALNNATKDSLLVFDELGRGTSTYDGIALAQSIIEFIHEKIHAKTLFSTHYHELTSLEESLSSLKNVHVYAQKENDELIFFHKITDGAVKKSYGIDVARIADLPLNVISRASRVISELEQTHSLIDHEVIEVESKDERIATIAQINPNTLTPIEALNKLNEVVDLCKDDL